MKKFCIIIAALIMLVTGIFGTTVASADSSPTLTVGTVSGFAGEVAEVPVVISGNPGITALSFEISYDSTKISLISATDGAILGSSTATFGNDVSLVPYTLCWDDLSSENNMGNGTVATLKFRILNGASGNAEIKIKLNQGSTFNVDFEDVEFRTVNGSVSITPVTLSSVKVKSNPENLNYYVGDTINTRGLTLAAIYNNGTTKTVTSGFTCTPLTLEKAGTRVITVIYGGKTDTFSVNVEDKPEATTKPETTTKPEESTTANESKIKASVSIRNNHGAATVRYGETLRLSARVNDMPAGGKICWYVDGVKKGEGESFDVSFSGGTKTVEVKLVDSNGNVIRNSEGNEISDSEEVTVKAGFFDKLVAFFRSLFGSNQTIIQ